MPGGPAADGMHQFDLLGMPSRPESHSARFWAGIHFREPADDHDLLNLLFGFPVGSSLRTMLVGLFTARHRRGLVLAGIALALARLRIARAGRKIFAEIFPLVLLFAISVTGLARTASSRWSAVPSTTSSPPSRRRFGGAGLSSFGKFFYIFQSPAQLGGSSIKETETGAKRRGASAAASGSPPECNRDLKEASAVGSTTEWRTSRHLRNLPLQADQPGDGADELREGAWLGSGYARSQSRAVSGPTSLRSYRGWDEPARGPCGTGQDALRLLRPQCGFSSRSATTVVGFESPGRTFPSIGGCSARKEWALPQGSQRTGLAPPDGGREGFRRRLGRGADFYGQEARRGQSATARSRRDLRRRLP